MRAYFLTDFVQVCTKFVFVKMSVLTTYLPFDIDLRFPLSCAFLLKWLSLMINSVNTTNLNEMNLEYYIMQLGTDSLSASTHSQCTTIALYGLPFIEYKMYHRIQLAHLS